jgi:hypothetical protein
MNSLRGDESRCGDETFGSLRSRYGRKTSWVVEFSVTTSWRFCEVWVATLQIWPQIAVGSGILGHELVTTSWRFCEVWVATLQIRPQIAMGSGILGHELVTTSWRFVKFGSLRSRYGP